jgi:hypothetical protein
MSNKLVTFGDSWPLGVELQDKTKSFGHKLAEMLDIENYETRAVGASGNDRMIFQLQEYIKDHSTVKDHVAVFYITTATRRLHLDSDNNIVELKVPADWKKEPDLLRANWYRYFHTNASDKFNLYKILLSLQQICQQCGIKDYYISGWTDIKFEMIGVDTKKIFPSTCLELFGEKTNCIELDTLGKNYYWYPNKGHPNEQGHLLIANKLFEWINGVQSKI